MQLFQPEHYSAFEKQKQTLDDKATCRERQNVRDRFLELDNLLWPFIKNQNWDLHRHRQKIHYVSSDHFIYLPNGMPIVDKIDSMWLHYGKSPEQLDFLKTLGGYDFSKLDKEDYYNAFYLHTRIQFYINKNEFRCWLLLATEKNYYDRSEFLKKLKRDDSEKEKLFRLISPLMGKDFIYEIDDNKLPLTNTLSKDALMRFIKLDKEGAYSGIFKKYLPEDGRLNKDRIGIEMIENLKLLYPLYDFMAYRILN